MSLWKRILVSASVVLTLAVASSLFVKDRIRASRSLRIAEIVDAVDSGKLEVVQVVEQWACPNAIDADDELKMEIWLKNGLAVQVSGTWVFSVSEDLSRLDPRCWKAKFDGMDDSQVVAALRRRTTHPNPRRDAVLAFVERGRKVPVGFDYEPVVLGDNDEKTFETQFQSVLTLDPGAVGKVSHQLAFPPAVSGYIAKVSLVRVEPF